MPFFAPVHLNDVLWVDGQVFVRIYDHAEQTRVCLEKKKTTQVTVNSSHRSAYVIAMIYVPAIAF